MNYNYEIIFAIASIVDTYSIGKLLGVFLGSNAVSEKIKHILYLIFYVVTTFAHLIVDVPVIMIFVSIGSLFVLTFSYHCSIQKRVLSVVFIFMILSSVETLVVLMSGYQVLTLFDQGEFASISGIVIIKILTYVLSLGLDKFKSIRSGKDVPISYWVCLFSIPFSSIFLLLQSLNYELLTYNMLTIEIVLFLVINLSVFYLYDRLSAKITESAERQIQLQKQAGYLKQYELMKTSMDSILGLKHDLKNHFMTLRMLAKGGEMQALIKYVEEMEEHVEWQKQFIDTKNIILDSILNYKILEAEKRGIEIVFDIKFPANLKLDSYDLTVVLGNLLDNAMEASVSKEINFAMRYDKGCMTIKVVNDFAGELSYDSRGCLKTKKIDVEEHGLGLKNIERIVEKYNGMLELTIEDQIFTVFILLYIE